MAIEPLLSLAPCWLALSAKPMSLQPQSQFSSEELMPLVYEELRKLAATRIADERDCQTLQPTALVHEVWLRLSDSGRRWESRLHFYNMAALAMRRVLIERARQRKTKRRSGELLRENLADLDMSSIPLDERLLLMDDGLRELECQNPKAAEIVMLKFFGGLTNKEVGQSLNVSEATIERRWAFAKVCLFKIMRELEGADDSP